MVRLFSYSSEGSIPIFSPRGYALERCLNAAEGVWCFCFVTLRGPPAPISCLSQLWVGSRRGSTVPPPSPLERVFLQLTGLEGLLAQQLAVSWKTDFIQCDSPYRVVTLSHSAHILRRQYLPGECSFHIPYTCRVLTVRRVLESSCFFKFDLMHVFIFFPQRAYHNPMSYSDQKNMQPKGEQSLCHDSRSYLCLTPSQPRCRTSAFFRGPSIKRSRANYAKGK